MNRSVLIVEDALDLRNLYKLTLRRKPFQTRLAASGEEALEILSMEGDVALMLLDMGLPGLSGEEVLSTVRSDPQLKGLKVLIMSGWDDLKERAHALGADGYLRKPTPLPELEARIDEVLAQTP